MRSEIKKEKRVVGLDAECT